MTTIGICLFMLNIDWGVVTSIFFFFQHFILFCFTRCARGFLFYNCNRTNPFTYCLGLHCFILPLFWLRMFYSSKSSVIVDMYSICSLGLFQVERAGVKYGLLFCNMVQYYAMIVSAAEWKDRDVEGKKGRTHALMR